VPLRPAISSATRTMRGRSAHRTVQSVTGFSSRTKERETDSRLTLLAIGTTSSLTFAVRQIIPNFAAAEYWTSTSAARRAAPLDITHYRLTFRIIERQAPGTMKTRPPRRRS
jgi:hypothetical protein